jgi:hypothetical protein
MNANKRRFLLIVSVLALAVSAMSPAPITAASSDTAFHGTIRGVVWQDYCAANCAAGSSLRAGNGRVDIAEARLYGIRIGLSSGKCSGGRQPSQFTRTDRSGAYKFTNLSRGTYCLTLNAKQSNSAFHKPGQWTSPIKGLKKVVIRYTVTFSATSNIRQVNFGWNVTK